MKIDTLLKLFPILGATVSIQAAFAQNSSPCSVLHNGTLPQPCSHASSTPMPQPCDSVAAEPSNRWGVQASIVEGGYTSLGLVNYGEHYSFGVTLAGLVKTNGSKSSFISPTLFGGPRFKIKENTYFAVGLDVTTQFGKKDGSHISSAVGVGPYVSIEYYFSRDFLTSLWINPYFYERVKLKGQNTTTHKFMTGGIGFSYLF